MHHRNWQILQIRAPTHLQRVGGSVFSRMSLAEISCRGEGQGLRICPVGLSTWPWLPHSVLSSEYSDFLHQRLLTTHSPSCYRAWCCLTAKKSLHCACHLPWKALPNLVWEPVQPWKFSEMVKSGREEGNHPAVKGCKQQKRHRNCG